MKKGWTIMVLLAGCFTATAQQKEEYDSDYYESYTDQITGRVYFSQKYTNLILLSKHREDDLRYRPNTTLNFGVGATYGWFTWHTVSISSTAVMIQKARPIISTCNRMCIPVR
jgi:hypothetical protein